MLRIRGSIGDWPVDLTLELDEQDWARLGCQLQVEKVEAAAPAASTAGKPVNQDDALWLIAQDLLRQLVDAGVEIRSFDAARTSLEQVFLKVYGTTGAGVAA